MQEHHITVPRTARYVTLGPVDGEVREVWFACHGYRQLAHRFARDFEGLDDGSRLIVVPEGLSRFYFGADDDGAHRTAPIGASWMTREDRLSEINDHVGYLDAVYARTFEGRARERVRCVVLGFSQGAATVSRWLRHGHAWADDLVLWGGFLPSEIKEPSHVGWLTRSALTVVVGTGDEFISAGDVEQQRERLATLGLTATFRSFDGPHELDRAALAEIAEGARPQEAS